MKGEKRYLSCNYLQFGLCVNNVLINIFLETKTKIFVTSLHLVCIVLCPGLNPTNKTYQIQNLCKESQKMLNSPFFLNLAKVGKGIIVHCRGVVQQGGLPLGSPWLITLRLWLICLFYSSNWITSLLVT